MNTYYVKRAQILKDVLGMNVSSVRTVLIRVTVNRLRKLQWEWVCPSRPISRDELTRLDRYYPVVLREGLDFDLKVKYRAKRKELQKEREHGHA